MTGNTDERRAALRGELQSAQAELMAVLDRVRSDDWARTSPDTPDWSVLGLLTHLSTAERGFVRTIERQARGEGGVPTDFDPDRWNAAQLRRNVEATPAQLREQLEAAHAEMLSLLERLDDAALEQRGWMTIGREGSVEDVLKLVASHKRGHTADIAKAVVSS
jgi:uncharacterized damage-inducible protein DinB